MRRLLLALVIFGLACPSEADIAVANATSTVAFAANGNSTVTAGTGTCTPSTATLGTVGANDIILLVATSERESSAGVAGAPTLSTANNFVQVPDSPQTGGTGTVPVDPEVGVSVFWVRGSSWTSAPVVADSGNHTTCALHRFTGAITTGDPWDVTAGGNDSNASDTTGVIPGDTTTVANTLVVLIQATSNNATATTNCGAVTNADLATITEQFDSSNTSGLGGGHCIITGEKASIGTYADSTLTMGSTTFKGALSIALKPGTGDIISSVQGTTVSSVTIPAIETVGSDKLIFVGAASSAATFSSTSTVVRGGSENFTESWDINNSNHFHCSGHYFKAPASASASIVVTFAATRDEATAGAIQFTGVDQTTPVGTPGTNTGTTSPSTVTVTAADDEVLVDITYSLVTAITVGADQTSRWEQENIAGAVSGGSSTQLGSVAGDVMSWSWAGGSDEWVIGAIPLKPTSGAPPCTPTLALLGVGRCG